MKFVGKASTPSYLNLVFQRKDIHSQRFENYIHERLKTLPCPPTDNTVDTVQVMKKDAPLVVLGFSTKKWWDHKGWTFERKRNIFYWRRNRHKGYQVEILNYILLSLRYSKDHWNQGFLASPHYSSDWRWQAIR